MIDERDTFDSLVAEVRELHRRLVHDAPIEQAVGIVMGARRCCPDEARAFLMAVAAECHAEPRDVAVLVVQETTGGVQLDFDRWQSRVERGTPRAGAAEGFAVDRRSRASARDVEAERRCSVRAESRD